MEQFTEAGTILAVNLLAHQSKRVQELESQVQRVRELHKPDSAHDPYFYCIGCSAEAEFDVHYPCSTIEALDGEQ